jgi:hypothetical protein
VRDVSSSGSGANGPGRWAAIDGSESIIVGDLSTLANGEPVRLGKEAGVE